MVVVLFLGFFACASKASPDTEVDSNEDVVGDLDTDPIDPAFFDSVFDPTRVYLFGTLAEGSDGNDVVADIRDPNTYLADFPTNFVPWSTALLGDRLIYFHEYGNALEDVRINEFRCDRCGTDVVASGDVANDIQLPFAPCADEPGAIQAVVVSPLGQRLVQCDYYGPWFDQDGVFALPATQSLRSMGYEGKVLTGYPFTIADLYTGTSVPVTEIPAWADFFAVRARPDGFWIGWVEGLRRSLWLVRFDGTATRVARYANASPNVASRAVSGVLDAEGNLYEIASEGGVGLILRYSQAGAIDVVYDEDEVVVKAHGVQVLLTGP